MLFCPWYMYKYMYMCTCTHVNVHVYMYKCTCTCNASSNSVQILFSSSASSVSCLGQEFRTGGMVCIEKPSDREYPVFGEIQYIIVMEDVKYLAVQLYSAEFCWHYFAYKVCSTNSFHITPVTKLALHQVYHKYSVLSQNFVVIRSCDHVELIICDRI